MSKKRTITIPEPKAKNTIEPERLTFAHNFKIYRKEKRISQETLSKYCGFTQSFISNVENGKTTLTIDNAAKLARAIGQPLYKLFMP